MLLAKRQPCGKPRSVPTQPILPTVPGTSGLRLADLPMPTAALFHRETTMFQIWSDNRRPSRGLVLASITVTVL